MNWKQIASRDAELQKTEAVAGEALAKHRYDHTIAVGVSFAEYARRCGVGESQVRQYANAWEIRVSGTDTSMSFSDTLVRSSSSVEQAEVLEAVAEARGISLKTVRAHHTTEVRRVREIARERAEKRGTTVAEEARAFAEFSARSDEADKTRRIARKERTDFRYIELEADIDKARRALMAALRVEVDLDDDMRELITDSLSKLRAVLELVSAKFTDMVEVDWDAELHKLGVES